MNANNPFRRLAGWLATVAIALVCTGGSALAQSEPISVFFDARRSDVNASGKQLITIVTDELKKADASIKLTIVGHADTAEPDPAKLSLARALAVAKVIVDIGIPAGIQLTLLGKGATELRKKTGPKVAEPVNRYVGIYIHR